MTDTQNQIRNEFCEWLKELGLSSALPIRGEHVALYLVVKAESGCTLKAIGSYLHDTRVRHLQAGFPSPTDSPIVKEAVTGLNRHGLEDLTRLSQPRPLYAGHIEAIRSTACHPRSRETDVTAMARGRVDVALVCTMADALLRPIEASLVTWGAISLDADGSGRVFVGLSTTDGKVGVHQWLSPTTMEAVETIRPEQFDEIEPVFNLSSPTIGKRVRAMARAANLGNGFTGFSPRIGMILQLVRAGITCQAILRAAGWRDHSIWAYHTGEALNSRSAVEAFYESGAGTSID